MTVSDSSNFEQARDANLAEGNQTIGERPATIERRVWQVCAYHSGIWRKPLSCDSANFETPPLLTVQWKDRTEPYY